MLFRVLLVLLSAIFISAPSADNAALEDGSEFIGIKEQLGKTIPLDLELTDSENKKFKIRDFVKDKPIILNFVYYRCPGICSPLLAGLANVTDHMDIHAGIEYRILTISMDPGETYDLAASKKVNYFNTMKRKMDPEAWKWTVGDADTVHQLTKATGFYYKRAEDGNFIHSGALIAISPKGKIARYVFGEKFLPFDMKMALAEAEQEKTGPTVAKLLKYCFSYDPEGRKYVFNILRVVGTLILFWVIAILIFVNVAGPNKKNVRWGTSEGTKEDS